MNDGRDGGRIAAAALRALGKVNEDVTQAVLDELADEGISPMHVHLGLLFLGAFAMQTARLALVSTGLVTDEGAEEVMIEAVEHAHRAAGEALQRTEADAFGGRG